jgi:hypothetical protein
MTIKDLKELIKDLPDDMLVGGSGHYGEYLECYGAGVINVAEEHVMGKNYTRGSIDILNIEIVYPGEEPN